MKRIFVLAGTHMAALVAGFGLGVYLLPILTAPPSLEAEMLTQAAEGALFTAEFEEDLRGNDALHWGRGSVSITETRIVHEGSLSPGPDYRLYLVPEFVEHEDEFTPIQERARMIGEINRFDGFILDLPADVDLTSYTTVLVWCEAFGEFIAAARYR
ncbi:MAG: DM13 domain-containing protein [Candidatus Competibacterales bacterium]